MILKTNQIVDDSVMQKFILFFDNTGSAIQLAPYYTEDIECHKYIACCGDFCGINQIAIFKRVMLFGETEFYEPVDVNDVVIEKLNKGMMYSERRIIDNMFDNKRANVRDFNGKEIISDANVLGVAFLADEDDEEIGYIVVAAPDSNGRIHPMPCYLIYEDKNSLVEQTVNKSLLTVRIEDDELSVKVLLKFVELYPEHRHLIDD